MQDLVGKSPGEEKMLGTGIWPRHLGRYTGQNAIEEVEHGSTQGMSNNEILFGLRNPLS